MTTTLPCRARIAIKLAQLEPLDDQITITEIDTFMGAMKVCYNEMSPDAKNGALLVAHTLAKIRVKLKRSTTAP